MKQKGRILWNGLMYALLIVAAFLSWYGRYSDFAPGQPYLKLLETHEGYTSDSYTVGMVLGLRALKAFPDYERCCDSYLKTLVERPQPLPGPGDPGRLSLSSYEMLLQRASRIETKTDPGYLQELEGFASVLSGGREDVLGDGKLSRDEYMVVNLVPEIAKVLSIHVYARGSAIEAD